MKRITAVLIGLGLLAFANQGFSESPFQHQSVLCASVTHRQPSAWVLQRLGQDFFDQESTRTVSDYPVAVRSVFIKGKDSRIFLVSRWYGFAPQRTYTFSCQWIDPDGETHAMDSASFRTPETLDPGIFFTYTTFMDLQRNLKEGEWTVCLLLNGDLVEVKDLTIASE